MQFNSYSYLGLLFCAVAVFWALPPRTRRLYVLALSIGFYATWSPVYVLVPIALCIGVFLIAQKCVSGPRIRSWYWGGISYAVAFLVAFRYHESIGASVAALERAFRIAPAKTAIQIAVPLGISFYTFEAISYLIDIRQKRSTPNRFSDLLLFVMFWPHVIAGPIVRFRELAPQLGLGRAECRFLCQRGGLE